MITGILIAAGIVGAIGIFIGLFLGVAGIKFKVEVDPREEAVLGVLPGNNCGGCGYAGCSGLAAAIAKGEAPVNACPVGGDKVGAQVARLLSTVRGIAIRPVRIINTAAWRTAGCCPLCQTAAPSPATAAVWGMAHA